jgi:hypothetical protein
MVQTKLISGLIVYLLLIIVLGCAVSAFDVTLSTPEEQLFYPQTKSTMVAVNLEKSVLDSIVDLKYTVTITGPAVFDDNTKEYTDELTTVTKSLTRYLNLTLKGATSDLQQEILIRVTGSYVSNAAIGGGKKLIDENIAINLISTEKGQIIVEKQACEANLTQCRKDLAPLQAAQSELATCRASLEQQCPTPDNSKLWYAILIIVILIGVNALLILKLKRRKHPF